MRARQLEFFTPRSSRQLQESARRLEHGGAIRVGKRKLVRPFDRRRPMHVTLRSSRARGEWSMLRLKKAEAIEKRAYRLARENGVRIYQYANSGNHLHLLPRTRTRQGFQRFLRTFAAFVPRIVTGARKGNPIVSDGANRANAETSARRRRKFWEALAWSRIVNWGGHFFEGRYYVIRNELKSAGLVPYEPRKERSRRLRKTLSWVTRAG